MDFQDKMQILSLGERIKELELENKELKKRIRKHEEDLEKIERYLEQNGFLIEKSYLK